MSIRRVNTKLGEIKWEVDLRTNGRDSMRCRRRFDKKVDAENFLHDFKSQAETLKSIGEGIKNFKETTFAEEAKAWIEHGSIQFSPGHFKRVKGVLVEVLPKYGRLSPKKFTPSFLSLLQKSFKEDGPKNGTVNRKTEVTTAILNFSAKQKRIPFNSSIGFEKLRDFDKKEMTFWEREEAEVFLSFMKKRFPKGHSEH